MFKKALIALAFCLLPVTGAFAQTPSQVVPGHQTTNGCPGTVTACNFSDISAPLAFSSATVGTSSSQIFAANTARIYIMIHNPSAPGGNIIYCQFGGTPTVAGAGTLSISPGQYVTFEDSFIPNDVLNCIASGASTPMTYGVK